MYLCVKCKMPLPLMEADPDERASWICVVCGTRYLAAIDPQSSPEDWPRVRLAERPPRNPPVKAYGQM